LNSFNHDSAKAFSDALVDELVDVLVDELVDAVPDPEPPQATRTTVIVTVLTATANTLGSFMSPPAEIPVNTTNSNTSPESHTRGIPGWNPAP
jgi:hypothetical protein